MEASTNSSKQEGSPTVLPKSPRQQQEAKQSPQEHKAEASNQVKQQPAVKQIHPSAKQPTEINAMDFLPVQNLTFMLFGFVISESYV